MKTLGERIRQAREAKGWSGERLAHEVGYKTQSGIANLENRATGSGGNKILQIAQALEVSIDWLMNGPDCDNGKVPFLLKPTKTSDVDRGPMIAREPEVAYLRTSDSGQVYDEWTMAAIAIMSKLDQQQKLAMVAKMREFQQFLGPPRDGQTLSVAA